jgi:hypothetical protein
MIHLPRWAIKTARDTCTIVNSPVLLCEQTVSSMGNTIAEDLNQFPLRHMVYALPQGPCMDERYTTGNEFVDPSTPVVCISQPVCPPGMDG